MLLYLIVERLYDASLVLEDFLVGPGLIKVSFIVVFFWKFHNEKIFRSSKTLSIRPFWKVQLEVIYFYVVRNNEKPP